MVGRKLVASKTSVNLAVWNINGVKSKIINKFEDTSFINNIKCYDIIGLVETHLVESLPARLKIIIFTILIENKMLKQSVILGE